MKVKDIMTKNPIKIDKKTKMSEASLIMKNNDIGFLIVMDGTDMIGVITDRDITIRYVANNGNEKCVLDYMTKDVIKIEEEATIDEMLEMMSENRIKRIVVINNENKIVGVVSFENIVKNIKEKNKVITLLLSVLETNKHEFAFTTLVDEFKL